MVVHRRSPGTDSTCSPPAAMVCATAIVVNGHVKLTQPSSADTLRPVRMTQVLYIGLALAVGLGSAFQAAMITSMGRTRGPTEAAWISLLATLCGLALIFGVRVLRDDPPSLPA